ncbi:MAG: AraC family ligand binding domain-containing protein [Hylemonella sp.]|uniref:JmjC domain-containing protein n=1 Tax=Hylemonella sp. TaxID=2066020 RepID=UPI0022C220D2|nr:cupin domain-containing protein [Hylemonella sp.]MCZ8252010.1 AraC family ligand binding domain-containing protein [Hylemonella sp.]
MDINQAMPLLGGLSAETFMRRHWHKKPLLVRQAIPGFQALLSRSELVELAAQEDVESRLVTLQRQRRKESWSLQRGPFARRALPSFKTPEWTLLVQGVDLHHDAVHALMNRFRFIPDARLDDLMISYATEGGGVGPHYDNYDVFLLQAQGRRRWRIGRQEDLSLKPGMPVKILANFQPEQEFVLEPGDMLYLPPHYAHDGVAEGGECMTYSIGFRSPKAGELAQELLQRLAEDAVEAVGEDFYRDPRQAAVAGPAALPAELQRFAQKAVQQVLQDPQALTRALGEAMSEPKPQVWFEPGQRLRARHGVVLDRRTRMLYDTDHVYINGESYRAAGRDAVLMRQLADERSLSATALARASAAARELLGDWCEDGWAHEH